ncbi:MAG: 3-aminobutyryl-CoA ammonia lyase, partial [Gemmatimonadota bacterium]
VGSEAVHYGGELVPGAFVLRAFGDLGTEMSLREAGDEGLLRAYESLEFLAPIYAGDFLEVTGRTLSVGNTSRRREYVARVYARTRDVGPHPSSGDLLPEPIVVARGVAVSVIPRDRRRSG